MNRLLLFLALLALAACTPTTRFQVLQPAEITLPPQVVKIGLINRSIADQQNQALNMLEGLLTGESIYADRRGSEEALVALKRMLEETNRYQVTLPAVNLPGNVAGMEAGLIDATTLKQVCSQFGLDALVVLEVFDTDSRVRVDPRVQEQRIKGKTVMISDFVATAELVVKSRWRVYEAASGNVIDQFGGDDVLNFNSAGPTPDAAQAGLPQKRAAIDQCGRAAGSSYGQRIAPYWVWVSRTYYRKGDPGLALGCDYAKRKDWEKAAALWKPLCESANPKVAGKACMNMAVYCELQGNLALAMEYAQQAKNKHGFGPAGAYVYSLQQRKANRQLLEKQFGTDKK
jgi:tetratricopeptide (TPR) repeat protein